MVAFSSYSLTNNYPMQQPRCAWRAYLVRRSPWGPPFAHGSKHAEARHQDFYLALR